MKYGFSRSKLCKSAFSHFRLKHSKKLWQLKPISTTFMLLAMSSTQRGGELGLPNFGLSARMQCCTSKSILSGKTFQMLCTRSVHTFAIWSRRMEATDLETYRRYVIFSFDFMIVSQKYAQILCTTFAKVKLSSAISTTFEFSCQKVGTFQSIQNIKWLIFDNFNLAKLQLILVEIAHHVFVKKI